jgi:hypothetical protein
MALAPQPPKPNEAPSTTATELSMLDAVTVVESAIDAWLRHKDRARAYTVMLPREPVLDDAGHAEIVHRYTAAGWASAEVKDGALHLAPAASE